MSQELSLNIIDPLYGPISFDGHIAELIRQPILQRLRYVRLSNIDSVCMPGISSISRYEHALGAAHLASKVGFIYKLSREDFLVLQAAALIHDSAISPFGHLAEEAFLYTSNVAKHEEKWALLMGSANPTDPGGVNTQVYLGRESGLRKWADSAFGAQAESRLREIFAAVNGEGRFGPCIAKDVDLDNLDNLVRIAFHMGLDVDRQLPVRMAAAIVDSDARRGAIFKDGQIEQDIHSWLELRQEVYSHLMLSREDFIGKTMLLFATVMAVDGKELSPGDWRLTDDEFIQGLLKFKTTNVAETIKRWLLYDLWNFSELFWFESPDPPPFTAVYRFSQLAPQLFARPCFCYRIKDKRTRQFEIEMDSGTRKTLGQKSAKWLFGLGSPTSDAFTAKDNETLINAVCKFFNCQFAGSARSAQNPTLAF